MKTLALLLVVLGMNMASMSAQAHSVDLISVDAPNVADFVLFSSVKVKPETIVAFKNTVLPYAELTRSEDGCVEYRVHQSPDDPTQFETYEHWSSNDARAAHLAASYTVQFFKTAGPMFEAGYPVRGKFIELR